MSRATASSGCADYARERVARLHRRRVITQIHVVVESRLPRQLMARALVHHCLAQVAIGPSARSAAAWRRSLGHRCAHIGWFWSLDHRLNCCNSVSQAILHAALAFAADGGHRFGRRCTEAGSFHVDGQCFRHSVLFWWESDRGREVPVSSKRRRRSNWQPGVYDRPFDRVSMLISPASFAEAVACQEFLAIRISDALGAVRFEHPVLGVPMPLFLPVRPGPDSGTTSRHAELRSVPPCRLGAAGNRALRLHTASTRAVPRAAPFNRKPPHRTAMSRICGLVEVSNAQTSLADRVPVGLVSLLSVPSTMGSPVIPASNLWFEWIAWDVSVTECIGRQCACVPSSVAA